MDARELSFKPDMGEEKYIFASYAHDDMEATIDIERLHDLGFRIWYDNKIEKSAEWDLMISDRIRECSAFVVFVSEKSMSRPWVHDEIQLARDESKDIFPIFLANPETIKAKFGLTMSALKRKQGFYRLQYKDSLDDYYWELVDKLPHDTRESAEELDCDRLGMGLMPGINDIVQGMNSIPIDLQKKRRAHIQLEVLRKLQENPNEGYDIDSVFQLTSEQTNAVENLSKVKLTNFDSSKPTNLLAHPVNIGTAYISPLRLVTGLITRLEENWPPLVTSYSDLVNKEKRGGLEDLHYFVEYCWLAWGPSVLTASLLDDDNSQFMVTQAAYGDEANSLPLIMKKEKWLAILKEFKSAHAHSGRNEKFEHRQERGWPVTLKNLLIVKPCADPFFEHICKHELFSDLFGKDNGVSEDNIALYLPSGDEGTEPGSVFLKTNKAEAFYNTAYVWLMLEQAVDYTAPMEPGRIIPFFEHANLATSKGLEFLQHCLARKAIFHILECEYDPDYMENGVYRFATALFPQQIIEVLEHEISRLNKKEQEIIRRRLEISKDPQSWRTPSEVVRFADAVSQKIIQELRNDVRML